MERRPGRVIGRSVGASKGARPIAVISLLIFVSIGTSLPSLSGAPTRSDRSAPTDLDFTVTPSNPNTGTLVVIAGTASDPDGDQLTFAWDFGDGYMGSGQTVSHQFMNGTSNVTMFVDDHETGPEPRPISCARTIIVTLNSPPILSVTGDPHVYDRQATTFYVNYSDNDSEDMHRFTWSWGDGSMNVTAVPFAVHTYSIRGLKNMTVFCDDLTGLPGHNVSGWAFNTVYSYVNKPPAIVSFTADNTTVYVQTSVTFTCNAVDPNYDNLGFTFDFGDGTYAYGNATAPAEMVVSHSYSAPGIYDAWVFVTDYQTPPVTGGPATVVVEANASCQINLKPGWNQFAIPLHVSEMRASTLGLLTGDVVVSLNPSNVTPDKSYVVGISPSSFDFSVSPGTFYWVYAKTFESVQVDGSLPFGLQTAHISVTAGGAWRPFAYLGLNSTHHAAGLVASFSGAGSIQAVAIYNPSTYQYLTYVPGLPPTDFSIPAGQAVWIFCSASGTIFYSS